MPAGQTPMSSAGSQSVGVGRYVALALIRRVDAWRRGAAYSGTDGVGPRGRRSLAAVGFCPPPPLTGPLRYLPVDTPERVLNAMPAVELPYEVAFYGSSSHAGCRPSLVAPPLGFDRGGAALRRLVVVARPAHLVLRASFRSPSGALGLRKAEFAQERLRAAVGLHR